MSLALITQRDELPEAVKEMDRLGLVSGSSGNASVRIDAPGSPNAFLITPAGLPYPSMTSDQLVAVDNDLNPIDGEGVPSSESLLHLAIYTARPDVNAVMHTHSLHATALGVAGRPLPSIVDELVVYVGGGGRSRSLNTDSPVLRRLHRQVLTRLAIVVRS